MWAQAAPPPYVPEGKTMKVSEHVWVIPDGRVNLVPNIGFIVGSKATLVVDSGGFNDQTWLDDGGHPHTEALHITERFRRRDFGHMDLQLIVDDPKAYTKPWGATLSLNFLPDDELLENICENEKDFAHIVGK